MEERKTVNKIFLDWELEKEEEWLNGMAMSGWVLDSVGFCKYNFVRLTVTSSPFIFSL